MSASAPLIDPRSIITPEAFHVSPELLGLRLAPPRRRFAALILDLVFIGILTLVVRSYPPVFGIVVTATLLRAATRRPSAEGDAPSRARRVSIGCLGVFAGLLTLGLWAALTFDADSDADGDSSGLVIDLGSARIDLQSARQEDSSPEPVESRDAQAVRDGVSLYTLEEAIERYAALRRADSDDVMDRELLRALEGRLSSEFASDTLSALDAQITELEREAREADQDLREAEDELDDALSGGGLLTWMAAVYMTVLLAMTGGQTLGKRLMGIRVLRLDGRRISWWIAFERTGGYAAGLATGLLGFAQIYWDANRQGIHDRIVGTVVVREGLDRVIDWESAL